MSSGALGLGFYGNHEAHTGIEMFETTMRTIKGVIVAVRNETMFIKNTLEVNTEPELDTLDQIFRRSIGNSSVQESLKHAVDSMRTDVHNGTQNIVRINRRLQQLNLDSVVNLTHQVEVIRWPSTMAVLSVFALFCIILIIGICRNSRSTLIAFTVLGLLAVILNWLLVSVYVSSCVALGDLCVGPDALIYNQAGNVLDKTIVNYYMDCPDGRENPFTKAIGQGQQNVDNVESKLQFIARNAKSFYPEILLNQVINSLRSHLEVTERVLANLSALLDCKDMHKQYERAVVSICTPTLNGAAFMLIAAAGAGLAFILLIWISAHTWMYIRKRVVCAESDYVQVDEQDPFLPSSAVMAQSSASSRRSRDPQIVGRPRHTPPHTPPFPGAYNGRIPRGSEDHMSMHGRFTPPPSG
uniref:Protein tweety homolog n=1 Tax=Strigamia maritima TaxID=126957 RepID=T1JN26_STRMM